MARIRLLEKGQMRISNVLWSIRNAVLVPLIFISRDSKPFDMVVVWKVNPVTRYVLPDVVESVTDGPVATSSTMVVTSAPAPWSVIPAVMVSSDVHVHVPAGTVTVSPSTAVATAVPTSARSQLAAAIVVAWAGHARSKTNHIHLFISISSIR